MADVKFYNDTNLSPAKQGFTLGPYGGDQIKVYNPATSTWQDVTIPLPGIQGIISDCYIADVPHQSMPINIEHIAFLKMDLAGALYINWLPIRTAGVWGGTYIPTYTQGAHGFYVDQPRGSNPGGTGHMIGQAIRRPPNEIQGQYNSQYLISWYNRRPYNFFSIPAGTISSLNTPTPIGPPVEILVWGDGAPDVKAALNFTGTNPGASYQGWIYINGVISTSACAVTNIIPGNTFPTCMFQPLAAFTDGFYSFQVMIQTNSGPVTLGAAQNSIMNVYADF
jgi:hypothetical protein